MSGRTIYLLYFFLRCQSFVSSVGLLFLWSADSIRKGTPNGLEGAFGMNNSPVSNHTILTRLIKLGASAILLLSSLPRVTKGPIPVVLAVTAAGAGAYYGKTLYGIRNQVRS